MKKSISLTMMISIFLSCIFVFQASAKQERETGIKRGDVLMRSLRVWPKDEDDPRDTLEAAKAFNVDKIVWIYQNGEDFNKKVRAAGIGIGTTMESNAREIWYPEMNEDQRQTFADKYTMRNLKGEPVIFRHFKHFNNPYIVHFQPDIIIDGWSDLYADYVTSFYKLGIDTIHRDDPSANWAALRCGGTFTDSTVEYFRKYLEDNYTDAELKELGVDDIKTFNVREHFLKLGAPADDSLWKWKGSPLLSIYSDAMLEATVDFYNEVRSEAEKRTGKKIPWSRNGVGAYSKLDDVFDFRIGEYQRHHSQPQTMLFMSRYAADRGRLQATISMVDGAWDQHPEEYVRETRKHIPTAYAVGMLPLVPWCMYMHQAPRYYGSVEDFGDLYHFVSENKELFNGHILTAANGIDTNANLYSWLANKELKYPDDSPKNIFRISGDNIFAFLRENKDTGSKVIHLIDWNDKPESFKLSFNPQDVTDTAAADIKILRFGKDDINIKEYAGSDIEVPALSPWAIVTVKPAKVSKTVAPEIISPARRIVPAGTKLVLKSGSNNKVFWRFADGQFNEYDPAAPPLLEKDRTLEIYAVDNDGSKSDITSVRYQLYDDLSVENSVIADASPAKRLENSFTAVRGEMKVNGSFLADELYAGGKKIKRGISTQGNSLITCGVEPSWNYFTVKASVDDAEDRRPAVRFQVWFDSEMAYETPILNPSKLIIADQDRKIFDIALKIPKGASQIRLVSVPSGFFKEQNNVVWIEPLAYK